LTTVADTLIVVNMKKEVTPELISKAMQAIAQRPRGKRSKEAAEQSRLAGLKGVAARAKQLKSRKYKQGA
jgi:hypothetical protein